MTTIARPYILKATRKKVSTKTRLYSSRHQHYIVSSNMQYYTRHPCFSQHYVCSDLQHSKRESTLCSSPLLFPSLLDGGTARELGRGLPGLVREQRLPRHHQNTARGPHAHRDRPCARNADPAQPRNYYVCRRLRLRREHVGGGMRTVKQHFFYATGVYMATRCAPWVKKGGRGREPCNNTYATACLPE